MGALITFSSRLEEIAAIASGHPDPENDPTLHRDYHEVWWALHDRRSQGDECVEGLGAEIKLSWNGCQYDVTLTIRQAGKQCRFQMDSLFDLARTTDLVMRGLRKVPWFEWTPYKGTAAAEKLREKKQKAAQRKKD